LDLMKPDGTPDMFDDPDAPNPDTDQKNRMPFLRWCPRISGYAEKSACVLSNTLRGLSIN
jgi:hypothetical protein